MGISSAYNEQITQLSEMMDRQVSELDDKLLCTRPGPELNPVGFIYYHVLRTWDLDLNILVHGREQTDDAWHRGGFTEAMGYSPIGKGGRGLGIGFGYTDAEVDEVPYQLEALRRYQEQLLSETTEYLNSASDEELSREISAMGQSTTTGARIQHTIAHTWNHVGEIRLTKSMLGFPDPATPPRN